MSPMPTHAMSLTPDEKEVAYAFRDREGGGSFCQHGKSVLIVDRHCAGPKRILAAIYHYTSAAHVVSEQLMWLDRKPWSLGGVADEPLFEGDNRED